MTRIVARAAPALRFVEDRSANQRAAGPAPLRIAVIGPSRAPIRQPFLGGLESHVHNLVTHLRGRGHDVTLFAAPGSDPSLRPRTLALNLDWLTSDARRDVSMQPESVVAEHHAYLTLMLQLAGTGEFDVIHNHSVHYLPVAMAAALTAPMITTLHTPPTPWLQSALAATGAAGARFAAVSRYTAQAWRASVSSVEVVHNGIDTTAWTPGPGGTGAVWFGRIAPEKGLHLALDAAQRAGLALTVAGPVVDQRYFDQCVRPRLGPDVTFAGHLPHDDLARLVGSSAVALVTPDWDEPYGLVVAEAMACGTPVAAFARGGVPEIVGDPSAVLAEPGDVAGLAAAARAASDLDRCAVRNWAERHCSVDVMIAKYEAIFADTLLAASA